MSQILKQEVGFRPSSSQNNQASKPASRQGKAKSISPHFDVALRHYQSGHLQEAEDCLNEILQERPSHGTAWHLMGTIEFQQSRYAAAIESLQQAIALGPDGADAYFTLGNAYRRNGKLDEAIAAYQQLLQLQPGNASAYSNLGVFYIEKGQYQEAIRCFQRAIELTADNIDSLKNLGTLYLSQGQNREAIDCFVQVIQKAPRNIDALQHLGYLYKLQNKYPEAIDCLKRVIEQKPDHAGSHNNLGYLYKEQGQLDQVEKCLQQAISLNPNLAEAHNNLGDLYREKGKFEGAQRHLRRAIALRPSYAEAHYNLGNIYQSQGSLSDAIQCYKRALKFKANYGDALNNLGNVYTAQGNLFQAIQCYRQALEVNPDYAVINPAANHNLLFGMHYSNEHEPSEIFAEHRKWAKRVEPSIRESIQPCSNDRSPQRRLRIGYMSGDFKTHSVAYFFEPLLAAHDHHKFEIICYVNNKKVDATTQRLRQLADSWREIAALKDEQVAELVRQDEIDILIDLSGHTAENRLFVFARKPAPIQVSYIGYPDTTGLSTIDYRLTDAWADPVGQTEHLHTEELVRLPHGFLCYQPSADCPPISVPPVLSKKHITFGSFNKLAKVGPQMVSYWAAILKAVPNSRLLIKSKPLADGGTRNYLQELFQKEGIESHRLELIGWLAEKNQHLGLYNQVDIALDTFPYHGTTTTCEALWMGVPVVTLAGPTHVSRVGVSLHSSIGLEELITQSPDEYIQKAISLANNIEQLQELRANLRKRMQAAPLTNASQIAQSVEETYRIMWQRWCTGEEFSVSPIGEDRQNQLQDFQTIAKSKIISNPGKEHAKDPSHTLEAKITGDHNSSRFKFLVEKSPTPIYQRIINAFSRALAQTGHIVKEVDPSTCNNIKSYIHSVNKENPDFCLLTNPICRLSSYSDEIGCFPFEEVDAKLVFIHHDNIFSDIRNIKRIKRKLSAFQEKRNKIYHFCIEYSNFLDLKSLGLPNVYPILHASEFELKNPPKQYSHEASFLGHILPKISDFSNDNTYSHLLRANIWNRIIDLGTKLENSAIDFAEQKFRGEVTSIDFLSLKYFYISMLHGFSQSFRGEIIRRIENANLDIIGGDTAYIHGSKMDRRIIKENIRYFPPLNDYRDAQGIYANSKVNLNVTSLQFDDAVINRVIDVGAVGGFILTDWRPGLDQLTSVSKEISYRTIEELNDKLSYYLHADHAKKRLEIARTFHQEIYHKCNYLTIVEYLLSKVDSISTTQPETLCLDLGCGNWKPNGYVGVDVAQGPIVDVVADLNRRFPFADNSVDAIRAHDLVEHLRDSVHTMNQIWRISKPDAQIDIRVPSTDGRGAFQDPTHVSFWNVNSFKYYCTEYPAYLRLCTIYGFQGAFSIVSLREEISEDNVIHVRAILKAIKKKLQTHPLAMQSVDLDFSNAQHREIEQAVNSQQIRHEQPDDAKTYYLSGVAAFQQGQYAVAIKQLNHALKLKADNAESYFYLGNAYRKQGQLAKAIESYQQYLQFKPNDSIAYSNLGVFYVKQEQPQQAIQCFQRAINLNPDYVDALNNLGHLYREQKQIDASLKCFQQAIDRNPNHLDAYKNLAALYLDRGGFNEARKCFEQLVSLKPDWADAHFNLGQVYKDQGNLPQALKCYQQALQLQPGFIVANHCLLFYLHGSPDYEPLQIYAEHRQWAKRHADSFAIAIHRHRNEPNPERKLRVGYVSGDLKTHSVTYFFEPLLANHDHRKFEIFCYANNATEDAKTEQLRQNADSWRDIHTLTDEQIAELVRQDQIDILVDLSGHNQGNCLLALARKPAPIQVSYIGYPGTTGLKTIDYRLTDSYADPVGQTEHLHTEELVRLPHGFLCYQPPSDCPSANSPPALKQARITFASFNQLAKLNKQTLNCWGEILSTVPRSRLLLKSRSLSDPGTRDYFRKLLQRHGIDGDRIELVGWIADKKQHLALYNQVDIALDTFPYNGTTTTCESLWMGVPVITLAGQTHVSRVGISLLSSVGLEELIAQTHDQYIQKAAALASNLDRLQDLRVNLRSRMAASPLRNATLITQSVEDTYRTIWRRWCAGSESHPSPVRAEVQATQVLQADLAAQAYEPIVQKAIQLAKNQHAAGRLQEAERLYQQILAKAPNHAEALHFLGLLAQQMGRPEEAIALMRKAIIINDSNPLFFNNLAHVLWKQDKISQAIIYFQKALELRPNWLDTRGDLALAYQEQGDLESAAQCYRQIVELKPDCLEGHFNLGNVLQSQAKLAEAIHSYQCVLKLQPDHPEALNNLGNVLTKAGKLTEAIRSYKRALEINPDSIEAHSNLGIALKDQGKLRESLQSYRQALKVKPDCRWAHGNLLLNLHYSGDYKPSEIYAEHQAWAARHAAPLARTIQPNDNERNPERRLRIGYVSGDFKTHSVAYFFEPLLAAHNPQDFEIICYANNQKADATTGRLRQLADSWQPIHALTDEQVVELIRQDRIDILVDLSGHTADSRLMVFARKPAPVQVSYIGYPDTTGLNTIDYRLTDAWADPIGQTEHLQTEQLVRLPRGFLCYQPSADAPPVGPLPVLSRGRITFGSLNTLAKVNPQLVSYWASILKDVPHSRLLFKSSSLADAGAKDYLQQQFQQQGIPPNRLELIGWVSDHVQHLAFYNQVDIALDTFPYNGTTTTCEALWMGVPVITLAGQTHFSRVGASLLSSVGMEEFIAQSPDNYIQKAINLANNREQLQELRTTLRNQMQSASLTNASLISRSVENAYRTMWQTWCHQRG